MKILKNTSRYTDESIHRWISALDQALDERYPVKMGDKKSIPPDVVCFAGGPNLVGTAATQRSDSDEFDTFWLGDAIQLYVATQAITADSTLTDRILELLGEPALTLKPLEEQEEIEYAEDPTDNDD